MFGSRVKRGWKTPEDVPVWKSKASTKRRWSLRKRDAYKNDNFALSNGESFLSMDNRLVDLGLHGDDAGRSPPPIEETSIANEVVDGSEYSKDASIAFPFDESTPQLESVPITKEASIIQFLEQRDDEQPAIKIEDTTHPVEVSSEATSIALSRKLRKRVKKKKGRTTSPASQAGGILEFNVISSMNSTGLETHLLHPPVHSVDDNPDRPESGTTSTPSASPAVSARSASSPSADAPSSLIVADTVIPLQSGIETLAVQQTLVTDPTPDPAGDTKDKYAIPFSDVPVANDLPKERPPLPSRQSSPSVKRKGVAVVTEPERIESSEKSQKKEVKDNDPQSWSILVRELEESERLLRIVAATLPTGNDGPSPHGDVIEAARTPKMASEILQDIIAIQDKESNIVTSVNPTTDDDAKSTTTATEPIPLISRVSSVSNAVLKSSGLIPEAVIEKDSKSEERKPIEVSSQPKTTTTRHGRTPSFSSVTKQALSFLGMASFDNVETSKDTFLTKDAAVPLSDPETSVASDELVENAESKVAVDTIVVEASDITRESSGSPEEKTSQSNANEPAADKEETTLVSSTEAVESIQITETREKTRVSDVLDSTEGAEKTEQSKVIEKAHVPKPIEKQAQTDVVQKIEVPKVEQTTVAEIAYASIETKKEERAKSSDKVEVNKPAKSSEKTKTSEKKVGKKRTEKKETNKAKGRKTSATKTEKDEATKTSEKKVPKNKEKIGQSKTFDDSKPSEKAKKSDQIKKADPIDLHNDGIITIITLQSAADDINEMLQQTISMSERGAAALQSPAEETEHDQIAKSSEQNTSMIKSDDSKVQAEGNEINEKLKTTKRSQSSRVRKRKEASEAIESNDGVALESNDLETKCISDGHNEDSEKKKEQPVKVKSRNSSNRRISKRKSIQVSESDRNIDSTPRIIESASLVESITLTNEGELTETIIGTFEQQSLESKSDIATGDDPAPFLKEEIDSKVDPVEPMKEIPEEDSANGDRDDEKSTISINVAPTDDHSTKTGGTRESQRKSLQDALLTSNRNNLGTKRNGKKSLSKSLKVDKLYKEKKKRDMIIHEEDEKQEADIEEGRVKRVSLLLQEIDDEAKPKAANAITHRIDNKPRSMDKKISSTIMIEQRSKKNNYVDIDTINDTPSIDYEQTCAYYFIPTCIRDCWSGDGLLDLCCNFPCAEENKVEETRDSWCSSSPDDSEPIVEESFDNESSFEESLIDRYEHRNHVDDDQDTSGQIERTESDSILESSSEDMFYVLRDSVCGMATCRY